MKRLAGLLLPVGAAALVLAVATALLRLPWLETAIEAMFDTGSFAGAGAAIDGDTLDVGGRRVRLAGVDAPELGQSCADAAGQTRPCGRQVRAALAEFIGLDIVTCRPSGSDRFGRVLAACSVRGRDLSAWLVSSGLAVAYAGPGGDPFRMAEAAARAAGAGLWAGGFDRPETWRRRRDP